MMIQTSTTQHDQAHPAQGTSLIQWRSIEGVRIPCDLVNDFSKLEHIDPTRLERPSQ
jgi:hypothetical protein